MSKILVTGASGHLGRLVVHHLLETEKVAPGSIVAGSRDPAKLADLAAKGIETRTVDFDAANLADAFAGIDRLLIVSTDALDTPDKRYIQHKAAIAAAAKAGVKRLFYTSMPAPETSAVTFAWQHRDTEAAVKATGIPYTIFRNGWYMENLFHSLPNALKSGQWYNAAGDGVIAHIARDDIARAIAAGLVSEQGDSRTYTLTGDTARTTAEIAALAAKATGKPLAVVNLTDEQLAGGMKAAGVPDFMIPTLVSFDTNTQRGHIAMVTGDFAKLTGRTPQSLDAFLAASKDALLGAAH